MLPHITPNQAKRFWAKVNKSSDDSCWEWKSKRLPKGYGQWSVQFDLKIAYVLTHRLAYFLATGDDPGDLLVCHTCDNPPCCNPKHLYKGTSSDNNSDTFRRARKVGYGGPRYHGKDHPNRKNPERMFRKLTAEQVIEIRSRYANGETQTALAQEFNMSQTGLSSLILRKTWSYL